MRAVRCSGSDGHLRPRVLFEAGLFVLVEGQQEAAGEEVEHDALEAVGGHQRVEAHAALAADWLDGEQGAELAVGLGLEKHAARFGLGDVGGDRPGPAGQGDGEPDDRASADTAADDVLVVERRGQEAARAVVVVVVGEALVDDVGGRVDQALNADTNLAHG